LIAAPSKISYAPQSPRRLMDVNAPGSPATTIADRSLHLTRSPKLLRDPEANPTNRGGSLRLGLEEDGQAPAVRAEAEPDNRGPVPEPEHFLVIVLEVVDRDDPVVVADGKIRSVRMECDRGDRFPRARGQRLILPA